MKQFKKVWIVIASVIITRIVQEFCEKKEFNAGL